MPLSRNAGVHLVGLCLYLGDTVVKRSGDKFVDLVKNVYRALLSRAMKGCYVYFMDKETENFFRSRTEEAILEYE